MHDDAREIPDERTAGRRGQRRAAAEEEQRPAEQPAPPTRSAAMSSASQPPRRCERNAASVTGIALSPAVVPEVFTQYGARPGHVTPASPAAALSSQRLRSR